ncbi:ABC transporter permease [Gloeobacter morelensis]|uniref:Transport permease protein n=1 Tax=Gloeobacter morelensis MG652769 TaxID=2781736 RepID=A0ABY3PH51_9CYAN|nr:ABC transporter permease [Gloeobacter morelensis]UFP93001.1 ABC transporter permease [Gloeobacter morelensis MG652769]
MKFLESLLESRLWALIRKETIQILKNRQLLFLLLFPPTVQLLIFGFALSPDVRHVKLAVADYAGTATSRELVAAFTTNGIFDVAAASHSPQAVAEAVRTGRVTAALIIPPEFQRDLARGQTPEVQLLIDAVDANTAGIASGYASQIVRQFGYTLSDISPQAIDPMVAILYNPGLRSSWFFVPGVLGLVLTLTSSLVSSATVVREKDVGTLEQLLMTPAAAWEILLAKLAPLFVLLVGEALLALGIARLVFAVPFRGNFLGFMVFTSLYICVGVGIGMMLATIARSQTQVVLTSFFVNLPLIQLSGAIAPIETMPEFFQFISLADPLRHYIAIVRGMLLKGVGFEVLWPNVLALGASAFLLLAISANRFRKQLE